MWSEFILALKSHDFQAINDVISRIDYVTFFKNPWVIGIIAICCIVFLIRGMKRAIVTMLSVPVGLILYQETAQKTNVVDLEKNKLIMFVLGFVVIAAVNIYFWVVRSEN
ncbi:MAG: hypothetical protein JRJ12_06995 [Deltaproteobacteria bacterium]|nr:hypothetical protein [Deltaproteobacteria bacterium]MBW2071149.1 hypothetical protein [Deltaproteobacteria bacterium]